MHYVFEPRDDTNTHLIGLNEDYDSYPEYFEDPLTPERVDGWLCNQLPEDKYEPAQAAALWRQMWFAVSDSSTTLLVRKMLGRVENYDTPQQFVRVYRRILQMKKVSNI
jgi:hypothetical protein